METVDLKAFRKVNNLTQTEVGDYVGCAKAFISAVEKGRSKLPQNMFTLLLQNPYGWDTSMLTQPSVADETLPLQEDSLIAELRATIERLENKVDNLNQEIGEKNALIKLLRQGGVESV
jgi:transcriptional regulator with XRE-family HTH domain